MNKTDINGFQGHINSTDFDEMKYLAQVYGPQRHPWDKLIPLMIGRCPVKRKFNGFLRFPRPYKSFKSHIKVLKAI